jgi:uncharacterized protein DUF3943
VRYHDSRARSARACLLAGACLVCTEQRALAQDSAPAPAAPTEAEPATAPAAEDPPAAAPAAEASPIEASVAAQPVDYNIGPEARNAGNYLWPLLDTLGINFALWGISYASGAPWAKISPSVWRENLRTGFGWDDNEFEVNQFAHPYQGGMYFSAARVNGLGFWESVPYTMFGSATWEYFAETEQPSTNDWMTTTWGGVMFGECLYRLSNRILDDSTSGSTRFWKEFAAFAVNPINGMDRTLSGQAWQSGPPPVPVPLAINVRAGADGVGLSEGTGWGKTFRARIRFDYGDLYAKPTLRVPFEAFDFAAQLSGSSSIFGQGIDATGVLLGNRFSMGDGNVNLLAWVMDFEYFTNGTTKMLTRDTNGVYQLGEMGTGVGWYGHWGLGAGFSIDSQLHGLVVPTGAITSPYAKYESNRSYSYGVGGAAKAEFNLRHERLGRVYANASRYLYYIVDGAHGVEHLGMLQLGFFANVYGGHGFGATAILYDRTSHYDYYPDLVDSFWSGQVHYEVEL